MFHAGWAQLKAQALKINSYSTPVLSLPAFEKPLARNNRIETLVAELSGLKPEFLIKIQ